MKSEVKIQVLEEIILSFSVDEFNNLINNIDGTTNEGLKIINELMIIKNNMDKLHCNKNHDIADKYSRLLNPDTTGQ